VTNYEEMFMLVNDLAAVLRSAGCVVEESAGWTTHNHGQLTAVQTIVIHHTAGPATGDYPSYNTVKNGRPDLAGPLANLGVGRSGKVYVFSSGLTYHAGTVRSNSYDNAHSIGIEVESVGTGTPWPSVQVQGAARATAALCRKFGLPVSRVLGHKEVCYPVGRKVDPVGIPGDMAAFRALVQQYLSNPNQKVDEVSWSETLKDGNWSMVASHALANIQQNVQSTLVTVKAQGAAITALSKLVADNDNDLTVDEVEAAVKRAISESVVEVDVNVVGKTN
jgi:N-acetylmuramoyl-L-alanine amidase-like protein